MIVSMVLSHTKFVRGLEPLFLREGVGNYEVVGGGQDSTPAMMHFPAFHDLHYFSFVLRVELQRFVPEHLRSRYGTRLNVRAFRREPRRATKWQVSPRYAAAHKGGSCVG